MKYRIYIQKTYGAYHVHLQVGSQYFTLEPGWETKKEAMWQKEQFKIALNNI